jgi:hypothetical protein
VKVSQLHKVSVQWVVALDGHFFSIINFQKEKENTFTLLIILIVKSLQIEVHSTNLQLWLPIYRDKRATTPRRLTLQLQQNDMRDKHSYLNWKLVKVGIPLRFDVTELVNNKSERDIFFQILLSSHNILTLVKKTFSKVILDVFRHCFLINPNQYQIILWVVQNNGLSDKKGKSYLPVY